MKRWLIFPLLAAVLCVVGGAFGQEASPVVAEPVAIPVEKPPASKSRLLSAVALIEEARDVVDVKKRKLAEAVAEVERTRIAGELAAAERVLDLHETDFQGMATGVDVASFGLLQAEKLDLAAEAQELLRPIFDELKELTERPRAIESLRSEAQHYTKQRDLAGVALKNLEAAIAEAKNEDVLQELQDTRVLWEGYKTNAENKLSVSQAQLEQGLSEKQSLLDTAADGFTTFFRSRGMNLIGTFFTFIIAYLVLRFLGTRLTRFSPWHKPGKRSFYSRLVDVLYKIFCVVGAGMAALIVLYASGDWVLIGLTIIFLFGLALAAKSAVPQFYEQARLLLNLGEVREGERVVIDGIPWKVQSLGVFTTMKNPLLDGGELRLPIRTLTELRSRPYSAKEVWFPSRKNEWVSLSDGTRGKVIQQTPETVHLILLGGSRKAYPTPDFLAATPEVLSRNFRVRSIFGTDYRYQAIATTTMPEILTQAAMRELLTIVDVEHIGRIKVEFREAGSSSLDFEIVADMKGEVADKYDVIKRALQKAAVDASNENGWTIPFPQLTLHRAELEPDDPALEEIGKEQTQPIELP